MNDLKDLTDREIVCVGCGNSFVWNREEQAFYLSKGLQPPKRCKECRMRRKLTIAPKAVSNE